MADHHGKLLPEILGECLLNQGPDRLGLSPAMHSPNPVHFGFDVQGHPAGDVCGLAGFRTVVVLAVLRNLVGGYWSRRGGLWLRHIYHKPPWRFFILHTHAVRTV